MSRSENFFPLNIQAAKERGTKDQQSEMGVLVDSTSLNLKNIRAHSPIRMKALVNNAVNGFIKIGKLRREIEGGE